MSEKFTSQTYLESRPEALTGDSWGGVTDPLNHDSSSFRYLIHLDSGRVIENTEGRSDDDWEFLVENPNELKNLEMISSSLVDQDHRLLYQGTMSTHGFIFEVPQQDVLATNPMDMFSSDKDIEHIKSTSVVTDGDSLLESTKKNDWNEVLVSPKNIVIKALFWVEPKHEGDFTYSKEQVKEIAKRAGLPFLELDLDKH